MVVRDPKTGLFKKVSKLSQNLKPVKKGGRPKGKKDSQPRKLKHPRFKKASTGSAVLSDLSGPIASQATVQVQPPPPAPAPTPAPAPAAAEIGTVNDSQIFEHGSPPQPKAESQQAAAPAPGPAPAPGSPPVEPGPSPGEEIPPLNDPGATAPGEPPKSPDKSLDPNALASLVWGMELNLMAAIFGKGMMPRKYVNPTVAQADMSAGELPYDEGEMVRSAWVDYLISLGVIALSPLKSLYFAHAAYLIPRMIFIVQSVKGWFKKKTPKTTSAKSEAEPEPGKPEPGNQPKAPEEKAQSQSEKIAPGPAPEPEVSQAALEQLR